MQVEVQYFGILAEITGCKDELVIVNGEKISELKQVLLLKYPEFKNKDFRVAQNKKLVSDASLLLGEEIALLPPFSGG